MEKVGVHGSALAEPAFREGVFPVVGVALAGIVMALFRTAGGVGGGVGVHIPYFAISTDICFLEVLPQLVVGTGLMVRDDFVKGRLQRFPFRSLGGIIVAAGVLCLKHTERYQ